MTLLLLNITLLGIVVFMENFVRRKYNDGPYNILTLLTFFFCLQYILVPISVNIVPYSYVLFFKNNPFVSASLMTHFISISLILITYLSLHSGYIFARSCFPCPQCPDNISTSFLILTLFTLIAIAVLALYNYSSLFGGLSSALINSPRTRLQDLSVDFGLFGFLRQFGRLMPIAFWLSIFLLIFRRTGFMFKLFMITLVSVSLLVSFCYFIFVASRGAIIIHILIAIFLFIYYRGKIGIVLPALGIVSVVLVLLYGRSFFLNVATQNLDQISRTHHDLSLYNAVINELSPQYNSLYASLPWIVIGHPDSAMFLDMFTGFLKLVPTKLLGGTYLSTSDTTVLNTKLITGMSISNIPPGHMAYFIYNLGIIGLILGSIGFGMICGAFDRFFVNCRNNDLIRYLYPMTSIFLARWMYFGDPGNYYRSLFGLAFFYFLLICYLLLRRALFR